MAAMDVNVEDERETMGTVNPPLLCSAIVEETGTSLKLNKKVNCAMLLQIIGPQLDENRAMQLHTLYNKLKKNEMSKGEFVRDMITIVGDVLVKMAVYKLQLLQIQEADTTLKLNKMLSFAMLIQIMEPHLDKDRAMQLRTLYNKLKKNEISKGAFVRDMRSIVGDKLLKMAIYKRQLQILIKQGRVTPGKVTGGFLDQSIEHQNDVNIGIGVNLREQYLKETQHAFDCEIRELSDVFGADVISSLANKLYIN